MKKVTLLALAAEEKAVLSDLRSIGVMQIEYKGRVSDTSAKTMEDLNAVKKLLTRLENLAGKKGLPDQFSPEKPIPELQAEIAGTFAQQDSYQVELDNVNQRLKALEVWGDFDRSLLDELKEKNIAVHLCSAGKKQFEKLSRDPDVQLCQLISIDGGKYYFAVIGKDEDSLPVIKLAPGDDPRKLAAEQQALQEKLQNLENQLKNNLIYHNSLKQYAAKIESDLEFNQVRDSLDQHDTLVSLEGFVPETALDKLRAKASACGWGLLINDPDAGDNVPVLLEYNRFTRWIKPLFDFLGISPGYTELDAGGGILVFFTIFYAMILGDAGYGCLFLGLSAIGSFLLRKKPQAKMPLRLLMLLSVAAIIWGVLCGSWFGVTWGGIPALTDASVKDGNIQVFCFLLAVVQLSMARIWKTIAERKFRTAASNLGWILILWGNFFLTVRIMVWQGDFPTFMYYLYGIGLVLVILFGVDWKNVADIFQFPFSVINSFTDILSYIRLFAVGMSGTCIAASFNDMAMDVAKSSPWFIIFSILILLAGHLLNLMLAAMGVLVHAVRLNTLEFSNHTGVTWSGKLFHPFKNNLDNSQETEGN